MTTPAPCTCTALGLCPRFGRQMTPRLHHLCQTRPDYREAFAVEANPLPTRDLKTPEEVPCSHRGKIERQDTCRLESCIGGPAVDVFACDLHGSCTVNQHAIPGAKVCRKCDGRMPDGPPVDVAVVIPCHNYGEFLAECLDSVLAQTARPAEIVVVDDSSTDATPNVAGRYAARGVRYLRVECGNVNLSRAAGMAETSAGMLCFLDADDRLAPDYLAAAVAALDADPGAAIAYTDMETFGADSGRMVHPRDPSKADITRENYIHAGSVVRRVAVESVRTLELPKLPLSLEDWELWRAIMADGWRAVKTPSVYHYRKHAGSMSWRIIQRQASYYDLAALERAQVTIAVPLSGRWKWWSRLRNWLEWQAWPHGQCRLILLNTSSDADFAREVRAWLMTCDYPAVQYIALDVGDSGLADQDRTQQAAYRGVQRAMPRIYNRVRQEIATPWAMIVEDDVLPPADAVERLLRGFDPQTVSVSGAYRSRYQPTYVAWRADGSAFGQRGTGVEPVGGNGFGCVMFRSSVLRSTVIHHGGNGDYDPSFYRDLPPGSVAKIDWSVLCDHAGIAG
jgi:glycosyltransferase involved in cell wall biosynthesis